jgi:hypothetical protein
MIKWISTKKEMPEHGVQVLVCLDSETLYDVAALDDDGDWEGGDTSYMGREATYWAHINAPESEGENG